MKRPESGDQNATQGEQTESAYRVPLNMDIIKWRLDWMLRICFLKQWFNVLDLEVEQALYDLRQACIRGVPIMVARLCPPETTGYQFRQLLWDWKRVLFRKLLLSICGLDTRTESGLVRLKKHLFLEIPVQTTPDLISTNRTQST